MLKISNLSKSYSKSNTLAVNDLSLELQKGEIFGFLGPNGAGKTTTIKSVSGILPYNSGEIVLNGINLKTSPSKYKLNFGYVSDNHIIYDKLTGREFVNFMADIYGVSLSDRKQRSEKMLEAFDLKKAYDTPIKTYSHGMKQKIHIIAAMIHNPPLWILDEPMTGLDPQSNYELKKLMRSHCDAGNTVFFSTHILEVAEKLCDRIGIIVGGKLIAVGTLEQLKNNSDKSLEDIFLQLATNESKYVDDTKDSSSTVVTNNTDTKSQSVPISSDVVQTDTLSSDRVESSDVSQEIKQVDSEVSKSDDSDKQSLSETNSADEPENSSLEVDTNDSANLEEVVSDEKIDTEPTDEPSNDSKDVDNKSEDAQATENKSDDDKDTYTKTDNTPDVDTQTGDDEVSGEKSDSYDDNNNTPNSDSKKGGNQSSNNKKSGKKGRNNKPFKIIIK